MTIGPCGPMESDDRDARRVCAPRHAGSPRVLVQGPLGRRVQGPRPAPVNEAGSRAEPRREGRLSPTPVVMRHAGGRKPRGETSPLQEPRAAQREKTCRLTPGYFFEPLHQKISLANRFEVPTTRWASSSRLDPGRTKRVSGQSTRSRKRSGYFPEDTSALARKKAAW